MRFAATLRILFVLILALGFMDQHNSSMLRLASAKQELAGQPVSTGNFSSHELPDVEYGEDIIAEMPLMICSPELIRKDAVTIFVPAPLITDSSPCWQPPESLS
jgi:hypothetical protein